MGSGQELPVTAYLLGGAGAGEGPRGGLGWASRLQGWEVQVPVLAPSPPGHPAWHAMVNPLQTQSLVFSPRSGHRSQSHFSGGDRRVRDPP